MPEDRFVNTFYYSSSSSLVADADALETKFNLLLQTAFFDNRISALVVSYQIKVYDFADPEPRVPEVRDLTWIPNVTGPGPAEVAVCLSYYSGQNLPRKRGRVYLGPIGYAFMQAGTTGRILAATTTDVIEVASVLKGTAARTWMQRSQTTGELSEITNVWVDNAWDTQRRRGIAADLRVTSVIDQV